MKNPHLVQSRSAERVTLAVRSEPLSSIESSLPPRFNTQADEACHQLRFESHQEQTFGGLKDKLLRQKLKYKQKGAEYQNLIHALKDRYSALKFQASTAEGLIMQLCDLYQVSSRTELVLRLEQTV